MEPFRRVQDPQTGELYSLVGDQWVNEATNEVYQGPLDAIDMDTGERFEPNEAGTAWQPVETSFFADDPTRQDRWRTGLSNIAGGALQGFAGMMEGPAIAAGALGWVDDPQDTMLGRAGGALRGVSADLARNPDYQGEFVADTLGNAVGSGLSFLAGGGGVGAGLRAAGLGARALTAGTVATTGALGASVGGAEGFRDALAHGADIETAYESAGGNAAFGLTEAAPIAGFLARLDRRTGGSVRRALVSAARQGGEEAIQEAVQTIGANAIAEGLYDPDRGMFEHVGEGAAAGFTVGALFGFVGNTLFGRRGRAGQQDQVPPPADQQPVTEETQETTEAPQPPFRQGERIRFRYGDQDLQGSVEEIIDTTEGPAARVRLQDGSELDVLIDEMQDVGPDLLALPPPERRTAAEQRQQEAEVLPAGEETIVPPAPIQGPEQTAAPVEQQQPDTDLQQAPDLTAEVPATGSELTIEPMPSGQSFLVRGNTDAHADRIRGIRGARWNRARNAFMFPNGRRADVERQLGDLLAPGQTSPTETVETTETPAETVTEAPPAAIEQAGFPVAEQQQVLQTAVQGMPTQGQTPPTPADRATPPQTAEASERTPPVRPLRDIFGIDAADQVAAVPEEQYATDPRDRRGGRRRTPLSLTQQIALAGGISRDEARQYGIESIGRGKWSLVRRAGRPLDAHREAAEEQGLLPAGSDINDLVSLILQDHNARAGGAEARVYFPEDVDAVFEMQQRQRRRADRASHKEHVEEGLDDIEVTSLEAGFDVDQKLARQAAEEYAKRTMEGDHHWSNSATFIYTNLVIERDERQGRRSASADRQSGSEGRDVEEDAGTARPADEGDGESASGNAERSAESRIPFFDEPPGTPANEGGRAGIGESAEARDAGQQETGPFGPVLRQFEGNYRDAALELERRQSGEAVGALSHPDIGPIALVWGVPGRSRSDGYGLAKIAAWHPEIIPDLPSRLAEMTVRSRTANRIRLHSERDEASVRLDWDGRQGAWLLTAYQKGARREDMTTNTVQELLEAGDVPQSPRRAPDNVGDTEARDNAEPAQEDRPARRPRRTTPEATDQPTTEDGDQDGLGDVDPEFRHSALTSGAGDIEFVADLGNAGTELAAELKQMWQQMGLPLSQLTLTDQVLTGRGQGLQDSGLDLSALEAPVAGKTVGQMAYISLTGSDPHSALWHEAFHVLENMGVFRPSEIETMARNPNKMRRMAAISWQTLPDDPVLERLSDRELRAYAYEGWRRRKDRGEGADLTVPPAIRRAFSRLHRMLERVRNFLAGRGYQSIDDIFARVTAGHVTTAADQQAPLSEQYRLDQDLMKQIVKGVRESSKATQGLIRRVWGQNPPPNVTIIERASTRSINGAMRYLATPQAAFRRFPALRRLIDQGIEGEARMSAWVNRLGKTFRDTRRRLNRSEFERVSQTLFEGDTQQTAFTDAQLQQLGLNEKEQAAYREIRDLFDQIGRLVDQHRRAMLPQVRAERLRLERRLGSALADARVMDTAEFRTLMGKRSVLRSRVRAGTATPKMQQDLADIEQRLSGLQAKNDSDQQRIDDLRTKMQQMEQRLDETSVRRIAGYVPHRFFGSWRLLRQTGVDQDGNPTWENVRSEDGFWRSRIDAVNEARRLSADEPGAQLRIEPVGFKWPFQDEGTQLSDAAYSRFVNRVQQQFGVEGQELRDLIQDVARKRFRRRIAPFAQRRLGVEGYSRDMERVIYNHIAQAVRYTVLDRLKFDAINTMEREGLSENRVLTQEQKGLQQALQAWWRDVNGQKQGSEIQFDEILDRAERNPLFASGMTMGAVGFAATAMVNPWFGAALGGYFGYRTYKAITNGGEFKARYLTGSLLNDAAHLKLGAFVNLGSAVVNMTQVFLNTYPILGEKYTLIGYRKASEALWDSARGKTTDLTRMMERNNIETLFRLGDTSHLFEKEGRIARASMFFFQSAETLNRATTFFGALEKARAEGKNEAQAQAYAREVVNRTQFHFGNANKPEILRNWFARVPLQFKNFLVQQLSFVVGLGKEAGQGNVRPLARFMLAMTLTAGVLGWPFMELLDIIMSQLFDFSPMQETANVAIDMMAEGEVAGSIAGLMARGMPSLFGVDISQRTGMGDGFFPTRLTDLYGPWIGTVINTGDLMRQGANTADVLRSVTAGAAPLQTLETAANGQSILWDAVARPDQFFGALGDDRAMVTNPRLRGSLEYEPTAAEMALRTVGLRPIHESHLAAQRHGIRREELIRQRQVRPYLNRIADAMATENRSEIGRIIQEAREAGIIITPEQARRAARDRVIDRGQRELRTAPRVVRPEFQERQRILEEGRQ